MEEELRAREGLYSLLRALFSYPLTYEVVDAIKSLTVMPDSPLASGLEQMQSRLQEPVDRGALIEALNVEMTRLMEGPGRVPAPPFASFYLHGGQLMGPAATAARQLYLKWQAIPETGWQIPADHIAIELGFLAYLARHACEATAPEERIRALQASLDFLRHHVWNWLPGFCQALKEASTDPFFTGLAEFTQEAVRLDLQWLEELLVEEAHRS
ncbi:Chaperone protein TorD [Candidatus Thermoflexus japonica]|uniref:Chaperone protein TorD n=1 Tax=Candidatus Thermoflexus japonica TaxID=2035417 RepID=A0A2H5Y3W1_9CHLR|nr:Chaperone protein TorD [Candidatus Thermoflexus japonica]